MPAIQFACTNQCAVHGIQARRVSLPMRLRLHFRLDNAGQLARDSIVTGNVAANFGIVAVYAREVRAMNAIVILLCLIFVALVTIACDLRAMRMNDRTDNHMQRGSLAIIFVASLIVAIYGTFVLIHSM